MSMSSEGPGWWLASDGRWYPPELHPAVTAPPTEQPPPFVPPSTATEPPPFAPPGGGTEQPPPFVPPSGGTVPPPLLPPAAGPPASPGPSPWFSSPPPPTRRRRRWGLWIALGVVAAVLLGGLVIWVAGVAMGGGGGAVEQGDTSVGALEVGDCVEAQFLYTADDVQVDSVDSADCSDPHDGEVYLVQEPPTADGTFPGDGDVGDWADRTCESEFEGYVGATYDDSSLDYDYLAPTAEGWEAGDRTVICLLFGSSPDTLRGSMKGSGR